MKKPSAIQPKDLVFMGISNPKLLSKVTHIQILFKNSKIKNSERTPFGIHFSFSQKTTLADFLGILTSILDSVESKLNAKR